MSGAEGSDEVVRCHLEIINRLGLHARAATLFVQTLAPFEARVTVTKDDQCVNGKSIIELMMLAAGKGSLLLVDAQGRDAAAALEALEALVRARFHEPE